MNSFTRKVIYEALIGMKVVSRIRELSLNVAGWDGVDFGGVKLWNPEAIS
jgi:hypothetical protein